MTAETCYEKKCRSQGCSKLSTHNFPNETKAIYCNLHRKDNMVIVKRAQQKTCEFQECKRIATHNFPNETRAKYCVDHAKYHMVHVRYAQKKIQHPLLYYQENNL